MTVLWVQAAACTLFFFPGSLDLSVIPRSPEATRNLLFLQLLPESRFLASLEMTRRGLLGSCPQICCTHEMSS